ncbi:MAG TPA: DUF1273 domain-containing protein [Bacillota bacterium]|nr:DUF1273 domain-containing protein [Bacillota bacterium]
MKVLTVTGYKSMELNLFQESDPRIKFIKGAIKKRLIPFLEEGVEWVIVSGQMGVEMWAAEVVLKLQDVYPIQLGIIPPFRNQDARWPDSLKAKYHHLLQACDFTQPIYEDDYKGPYQFQAKNKWFVSKSDGCLILMDEEFPGSNRFFYREAKRAAEAGDYNIYLITPFDVEDVVNEMRDEY